MASISSYIPMAERSIWRDIQPIEQLDGPSPLVPIMYSEQYRDATDYFRAVTAANEYSERALELTETIIRLNPSHYTVWQYRMDILLALGKDLNEELELMNEFAEENLKSYQVWHHRLTLLETLSPAHPSQEIEFIHRALQPDPKNYHTWAYLHWLYSHFTPKLTPEDWARELEWCERMLEEDGRNNSAWGWRWFLKFGRLHASGGQDEIDYAIRQIHKIPHNTSAWNYLRGVLKHLSLPFTPLVPQLLGYTARPNDPSPESSTPPINSATPLPVPLALEYLADAKSEQGEREQAADLFQELATEYDQMRAGYWAYRRAEALKEPSSS